MLASDAAASAVRGSADAWLSACARRILISASGPRPFFMSMVASAKLSHGVTRSCGVVSVAGSQVGEHRFALGIVPAPYQLRGQVGAQAIGFVHVAGGFDGRGQIEQQARRARRYRRRHSNASR